MSGLTDALGSSPWTYALILALVAGDAVLPLLPGETAIITGAILAKQGELTLVLVFLAAVAGALAGDQAAYWIGRGPGQSGLGRLHGSGRLTEQIDWGRRVLERRGPLIVVVARFVPGGRTAANLGAGASAMRWPRFSRADALGVVLWCALECAIGTAGGAAFRDSSWKPLAASLGVAVVLAIPGYALRHRLDA